MAHHTIWMGQRYKDLLDDIFHRQTLADDFSLYVHRPTATDPSFAPSGHDSFYVLAPVPHQGAGIDWNIEEPKLRARIIDALDKTMLPDLKEHLRAPFSMTPENFATDYLSYQGAGFSIALLFTQSAWFRFHNKAEGFEKSIFNRCWHPSRCGYAWGDFYRPKSWNDLSKRGLRQSCPCLRKKHDQRKTENMGQLFHFAGHFLSKAQMESAATLYGICREI